MMKLKWIGSLLILAGVVGCKTPDRPNLVEYVNPNIGTVHSRWFFYTPAAEPFGMAKLGASTNGTYGNNQGWEAIGYEDNHTSIDGFPCLHEFQIGGISLMPVTGEVKTNPGKLEDPDKGFRSRFDKKDETARPGYYSVLLKDYQVKAELTATARVGFQRYTFPETEAAHILLNIGNRQGESGAVRDAYIKQIDGNTIEGYVITEPEYVKKYQAGSSVAMYFYAKLDRIPESVEVFYQDSTLKAGNEIKGAGAIMCLNYKTKKDDVVKEETYEKDTKITGDLLDKNEISFDVHKLIYSKSYYKIESVLSVLKKEINENNYHNAGTNSIRQRSQRPKHQITRPEKERGESTHGLFERTANRP